MSTQVRLDDRSPTPAWVRAILFSLILVSFAVRLWDLEGKSLWSDEALTLRRAEQPLRLVFANVNLIPAGPDYQDGSGPERMVRSPDLHPPLYFLMMHFWVRLAGRSEFALRFPSVVAATLALPFLYVLASSFLSRETGLWAALLGAASPFYLWYAQEARMYTWLVVLSLASVYVLLALLEDEPRCGDCIAFSAITLALLYTHYAAFLLLAFETVVYVIFRLRDHRGQALIILTVLIVALVPLATPLWRALQVPAFSFTHRPLVIILREAWSSFSLGPNPAAIQPWWRLSPFLVIFVVGALMLGVARRRLAWVIGLGYLALPVLTQYALSFVKPNYTNPRHLMAVAPAWGLIMAQGLTTLRRRFWPGLVVALGFVLFFSGRANFDILTSHRFWKDDIRGAVEYIEARARPGDAIVLHHPVIRLAFNYYYKGSYPEIAIPSYGNGDDTERARETFAEWARRYDRIWFLYGPPPTYFPHEFLPSWADAHLFKVCQQRFEAWWTYVGVAAYDDSAPTLQGVPSSVESVDHTWGPLHLVGFRAQPGVAGNNGWLDLYWQVGDGPPDEPLTLKVRLRDEVGTVWYERTAEVLPFYTPAEWPADRVVRTELRLPLPGDLPPVTYSVGLEPLGSGKPRAVGSVRVVRSATHESAPLPRARFQGGIELLRSELRGDKFRAGYPLLGSLTWRADAAPDADYRLRVRLADLDGREVAFSETSPSAAGFPTSAWRPDDRIAGRLVLPLPADLGSGRYGVQIGLVDAQGGRVAPVRQWFGHRDWLTISVVGVEAWPMMTEPPPEMRHRLKNVEIAGDMRLRGYSLAREGRTLEVTLYWQAEKSVGQNYHVFVHVGKRDQPPLADAGGVPVDWTRPTTSWREGEVVTDKHVVSLSGLPTDGYELLVGLYDPDTGQRPLTVVNGDVTPGGYVVLEEVDVE